MLSKRDLLATRHASAGLLISDAVLPLRLSFAELHSADGHDVLIEWALRLQCVDSPADRQLLDERFTDMAQIRAADIQPVLEATTTAAVRRAIEKENVGVLLSGERDLAIADLIEAETKRVAFSIGLAILPPFQLTIRSPSREREKRLADVRGKLDTLAAEDRNRALSIGALAQSLADTGGAQNAARVIADLRLSDPLDLFRAAALADARWTNPQPWLWLVAGVSLLRIDPTRPCLDRETPTQLSALGPLRSVRGATIGGQAVLLIGARDGVLVVDQEARGVLHTFAHKTGSDFGFNSAAYLADRLEVVATHSTAGLVRWSLDGAASVQPCGAARSAIAIDGANVAFACDDHLAIDRGDGVQKLALAASEITHVNDHDFIVAETGGTLHLLRADELLRGEMGLSLHAGDRTLAAGFELAGVARAFVVGDSLKLLDFAHGTPIAVGPTRVSARAIRTRPGFVALVGADRQRVTLIDLSTPEKASELNIAARLDNRVADAWFA